MFSPTCHINIRRGIQTSPEWVSPLEYSRPCYSKWYIYYFPRNLRRSQDRALGDSSMLLPPAAPPSFILLLKMWRGLHSNSSSTRARAPPPHSAATKGSITTFQHWCILRQGNIMARVFWGHNFGVNMLFRHTLDNYSGWNRLPSLADQNGCFVEKLSELVTRCCGIFSTILNYYQVVSRKGKSLQFSQVLNTNKNYLVKRCYGTIQMNICMEWFFFLQMKYNGSKGTTFWFVFLESYSMKMVVPFVYM
jgi:hypothetical protein